MLADPAPQSGPAPVPGPWRWPNDQRDGGQHAVHEPARLLGRVLGGQLHRLGDHRARRHVRPSDELVRSHPEQRPVDGRHPVDGPADGVGGDQVVDTGLFLLAPRRSDQPRTDRAAPADPRGQPPAPPAWTRPRRAGREPARGPHGGWSAAPDERAQLPTRVRYSPVRVSTLTLSPVFTKRGTCTENPVSRVAGLRARTPGHPAHPVRSR